MPSQNPGIFRDFAKSQNVIFHEIDLHAGDEIPELERYDGLWVMGGSMNVWQEDEYPWLIKEKAAIHHAVVDLDMPFLGICLGHQLLAESLGGKAEKTNDYEVGLFEIEPTSEGKNHPLLKDLGASTKWVNVHLVEVTRAPDNAMILATSNNCKNQIMQVGQRAYSCQFHPEVCGHTLEGWMSIPGIPLALENLLGEAGLKDFKNKLNENLEANNSASLALFKNWCNLVFA
tara:strand:+ start:608 stop:1300 length:693 start_codon:yes stop_codon:yes gene_type:complete